MLRKIRCRDNYFPREYADVIIQEKMYICRTRIRARPSRTGSAMLWRWTRWSDIMIVTLKSRRGDITCCTNPDNPRRSCYVDNSCLSQRVRDRTGEIRPITTITYIVKNLKHGLLSGKGLNKAGYSIILDEESRVFAVQPDGMVCKSKSFPFMSGHSSLFISKRKNWRRKNFQRCLGMRHRRLAHTHPPK